MQHKNYDDMTLEESMKLYFQRDNNKKKISNQVINRRRINMFKILENNDGYFSEENIKAKEPFLYEIYIGWRNRDTTHESKKGIKLSDFLFSQMDKNDDDNKLIKEINQYGREEVIQEYLKVNELNKKTNNRKEDDIDELIRIMMLNYLYSDEKYECDDDTDLDYNDKENDNFDEENYFNSDD